MVWEATILRVVLEVPIIHNHDATKIAHETPCWPPHPVETLRCHDPWVTLFLTLTYFACHLLSLNSVHHHCTVSVGREPVIRKAGPHHIPSFLMQRTGEIYLISVSVNECGSSTQEPSSPHPNFTMVDCVIASYITPRYPKPII